MKILVLTLLALASSQVIAGGHTNHGKPLPPASVLKRFDDRIVAELARLNALKPSTVEVEAEPEPIEPVVASSLVQSEDARCVVVKKYARAMGLLRESGIPEEQLTRLPTNLGFDLESVKDVVFKNSQMDWGSTVELVKWNCDHFGFANLSQSLESFRTQPETVTTKR